MKSLTNMSCQVISDLLSLELSCVNDCKIKCTNNGDFFRVVFHSNDQRLELLRGILSYFDNNLESRFENLKNSELLVKELTAMYYNLGFTMKHEELFVEGGMDVENQCRIWSRIISYVKDYSPVGSNGLHTKIENVPRSQVLIKNNHLKEMLMFRVKGKGCDNHKGNNIFLGLDNERTLPMINDIEKDIKRLEDKMVELSEKECNEEKGVQIIGNTERSLKNSNARNCDIERLISEWISLVENYWRIHCGSRDNLLHYSSGFESADSLLSISSESTLEDSIQRDLTEAIHTVYFECHNISELISFLKEVKLRGNRIMEKNEEKVTAKIEKLHSYLSTLIPK